MTFQAARADAVQALEDLERHDLAARSAFRPVHRRSELALAAEAADRLIAALDQLSQFTTHNTEKVKCH